MISAHINSMTKVVVTKWQLFHHVVALCIFLIILHDDEVPIDFLHRGIVPPIL